MPHAGRLDPGQLIACDIARFQAVAARQVLKLEIRRLVMAGYLSAERVKTIDLTDKAMVAELDLYVRAIQQGKGAAQLLRAG